jgi:hypothetical protein
MSLLHTSEKLATCRTWCEVNGAWLPVQRYWQEATMKELWWWSRRRRIGLLAAVTPAVVIILTQSCNVIIASSLSLSGATEAIRSPLAATNVAHALVHRGLEIGTLSRCAHDCHFVKTVTLLILHIYLSSTHEYTSSTHLR